MLPSGQQLEQLKLEWQQALHLTDVRPMTAPKGSPNYHFAGFRPGEERPFCFLKVMPKIRVRGFEQEKAASVVLQELGDLGNRKDVLLGSGFSQENWYWLAFPWLECEEVQLAELTQPDLRAIGRLIGQLHRQTTTLSLPTIRTFTLSGELNRQLAKTTPETHQIITSRLEVLQRAGLEWESYERSLPHVLLHGDFGTRNIVRRKDSGRFQLIDFEHSAYGPCWLEMSKWIEFEMTEEANWQSFLEGYNAEMGEVPPLTDLYRAGMQLWMTVGILNFTSVNEDPEFRQKGLELLEKFDRRYL